jgi:precorrin-4 methylase
MKTTLNKIIIIGIISLSFFFPDYCTGAFGSGLSITGAVRQPLHVTGGDLAKYQSVQVQLNEVLSDGGFHGSFTYQGVPLKTLLELASIEKGDTGFASSIDLAIRVSNKKGEQVALSWGEVFYKNPSGFIIATSAAPLMPPKDCAGCHTDDRYKPRLAQYERKPELPKLVISDDLYADRCIEEVSSIEIVDLRPRREIKKLPELSSASIAVKGLVKKPLAFKELAAFPTTEIPVRHGQCKGYHGIQKFSGASLKKIVESAGINPDMNSVLLVSGPDGYRTLVSYGELFLSSGCERIMIADRLDGGPLKHDGKFHLVFPDDLTPDRKILAVAEIEIVALQEAPKLYVIGVGCGDTSLITLEAISYMAKASAFICPEDIKKRFAKYMGDKPVLFDMYEYMPHTHKNQNPGLSAQELNLQVKEKQSAAIGLINDLMKKNQSVALLDYGDPTIFNGSVWVKDSFEEKDIRIIPGISSFNVSNALLNKKFDGNRSIILTTPWDITANPALLKAAAARGDAAALFMALNKIDVILPLLRECYKADTPAYVVYKAGYAGSEKVVTTTIGGLQHALGQEQEKLLGLIYIEPAIKVNDR